jgi:hypothetical protein
MTPSRLGRHAAVALGSCAMIAGAETRSPASPDAPAPAVAGATDDDGPVRVSLPTEADRVAWNRSGFRLGLGMLYGTLRGSQGAPGATMLGLSVRPGIRLDSQWSVYLPLQYMGITRGARFAASVEPTWHVTPYLAVGLGLGYAGFLGFSPPVDPFTGFPAEPDTSVAPGQSYTYPDARKPLTDCTGVGVAAVGRVEVAYVLGTRTRTHVALEAFRQWTGCEQGTGEVDPYTGTENVLRQWWAHTGLTLAWGLEWR